MRPLGLHTQNISRMRIDECMQTYAKTQAGPGVWDDEADGMREEMIQLTLYERMNEWAKECMDKRIKEQQRKNE